MFIGALIAILFAGGTGCGNEGNGIRDEGKASATSAQQPSTPVETGQKETPKHVDVDLTDTVCHLNQPGVLIRVSGVSGSPAGPYYTEAQYRTSSDDDWSNYPAEKYGPIGTSTEPDSMVNWHWSCTADKNTGVNDEPGEYRFRISWPSVDAPKAQTDWIPLTVK